MSQPPQKSGFVGANPLVYVAFGVIVAGLITVLVLWAVGVIQFQNSPSAILTAFKEQFEGKCVEMPDWGTGLFRSGPNKSMRITHVDVDHGKVTFVSEMAYVGDNSIGYGADREATVTADVNSASDVSAAVKGDMLITLIIPSNDLVHFVASQELEFTGYMRGLRDVVPSPIKVIEC